MMRRLEPLRRRVEAAPPVATADGQASILVLGALAGLLLATVIVGAVATAVGREAAAQRAADLAAVAAAEVMHQNYHRLFEPAFIEERPNPNHLAKAEYLDLARTAGREVAAANGARGPAVSFPDEATIAPVRVRVRIGETVRVGERGAATFHVDAEAELVPAGPLDFTEGDGYGGPLAHRQGVPMRPDVAQAFDRMEAAARADGVALTITSGYRSDAEQAVLWARRPDPKWVARPGTSLHRNGTELDLGPPSAYAWLAANAPRFRFVKRYAWEPWHFGLALNTGSTLSAAGDGRAGGIPEFVPERLAPILRDAAQRWNVSAKLLAAQLYAESGFNPFAVSRVGAQGIAQFMPATARAVGLANPFDPEQAIHAQARLMRDLLRRFGSVPLALAAYNAGPAAVSACGCLPYAETRAYVARIIGLMTGAGVPIPGGGGLEVRLVR
jgi:soluble lytic murein transglycosylase-like protein